jgi:hypothetical protein
MDRNQRNLTLRTAKIRVEMLTFIVGLETVNKIKDQIKHETIRPESLQPKQWYNLVFMHRLTQCIYVNGYDVKDILTIGCHPIMIQVLYHQNRDDILQNWLTDGDHALSIIYSQLLK